MEAKAVSGLLCVLPVLPSVICRAVSTACLSLAVCVLNWRRFASRIFSRASGVWVRPYMPLRGPGLLLPRIWTPCERNRSPMPDCVRPSLVAISSWLNCSVRYRWRNKSGVISSVLLLSSCAWLFVRRGIPSLTNHIRIAGHETPNIKAISDRVLLSCQ